MTANTTNYYDNSVCPYFSIFLFLLFSLFSIFPIFFYFCRVNRAAGAAEGRDSGPKVGSTRLLAVK